MDYEPISNKYYKWYTNICQSRQQWNRSKKDGNYYENHHIIPKSLGGMNTKENLVSLTAKEHFLVHRLLPKFLMGDARRKMVAALHYMCNSIHKEKYLIKSRVYQQIRTEFAKTSLGRKNPHKGHKHTVETKLKMSKTRKGMEKSPIHRIRLAQANIGKIGYWVNKTRPISTGRKISAAKKGKPGNWKGRHHSPETIEKMRQSAKNRKTNSK